MPPFFRNFFLVLIFTSTNPSLIADQPRPPRLTVIIVVDQLAYSYLPKLENNLHWGLRHLMRNGISFINTYHPHALPETATGHAALSTGTYPSDHGYIANDWFDNEGKKVACDDDPSSPVFGKDNKMSAEGKSALHLMVDTLSDQCMLASQPNRKNQVYAVGIKSRAVIPCAGKLGKAIWFDDTTGLFTSSKAYFDTLPMWVTRFNTSKRVDALAAEPWKRFNTINSPTYNLSYINNYEGAASKKGAIQRKFAAKKNDHISYEQFKMTPQANQALFELATDCITTNLSANGNDKMVLWLCLSPLDYVGHDYGPDSLETIDLIYHLDRQLHKFMNTLGHKVKKSETLLVLTADHSAGPLPEILKKQGYTAAQRIMAQPLIDQLNQQITTDYSIEKLITGFISGQFYLNQREMNALSPEDSQNMLRSLKTQLSKQPGIKQVWGYDELANKTFEANQLEQHFKRQLFPGRSGQIIFQTYPYCTITDFEHGANHNSPYNYNTHVPLIFYQKKVWEKQTIPDFVTTLQFANTLAYILQIPKPSASTALLLPGIATLRPSELTYA